MIVLGLTQQKGANRTMTVKRPLREQRNMFGARIKIKWEEQLVDPLSDYITSVIALQPLVLINLNVLYNNHNKS